jgi:hypothetical protein
VTFIHKGGNVHVKSKQLERTQNIHAIVPVGNACSRMIEVRVGLNSGDFAIGSAVRVALPHSESHIAMIVPRDALVLRKFGAFIYQINSEDIAQQVAVKTGIGSDDHIEVFGEIDIGSPVVIPGAERIKTGQKVCYETNNDN